MLHVYMLHVYMLHVYMLHVYVYVYVYVYVIWYCDTQADQAGGPEQKYELGQRFSADNFKKPTTDYRVLEGE